MANDEIFIYSLQGERPTPTRLVVKPMTYHDYRFVFDGQGLRVGLLDSHSLSGHSEIWGALSTTRSFNRDVDDAGFLHLSWARTPKELSARPVLKNEFGTTRVVVDEKSYSYSLGNHTPNLEARKQFAQILRELFPPPAEVEISSLSKVRNSFFV